MNEKNVQGKRTLFDHLNIHLVEICTGESLAPLTATMIGILVLSNALGYEFIWSNNYYLAIMLLELHLVTFL